MAAKAIDLQPYASLNDEDCDQRITRAKQAANSKAEYSVFCGVHFMAEVASNARIAVQRMLEI